MQGHKRSGGIGRLNRVTSAGSARGDIRIIVSAPPAEPGKERVLGYVPRLAKLGLTVGLPILALLAIYVLPSYLGCRSQHDSGMFYHGMTVAACTRQTISGQISATQQRFEDIAHAIGTR